MAYYRGDYRGDYYRGDYYRGDLGGFLKKAGKAIGGVARTVVGNLVPGGGIVNTVLDSLTRGRGPSNAAMVTQSGVIGTAVRIGSKVLPTVLAGKEMYDIGKGFGLFGGGGNGKRRTMNHLNPKALSRATRRVEGFVKKARKAVSPLGYTVVRRGSGRCAPKKKCR